MTRRACRTHAPAFKAKVALAAIKGEKTLAELAQQYDVPDQITDWKAQVMEGVAIVWPGGAGIRRHRWWSQVLAKIGELTLESILAGALGKAGLLSAKR
jgi:transposase-like protein